VKRSIISVRSRSALCTDLSIVCLSDCTIELLFPFDA